MDKWLGGGGTRSERDVTQTTVRECLVLVSSVAESITQISRDAKGDVFDNGTRRPKIHGGKHRTDRENTVDTKERNTI